MAYALTGATGFVGTRLARLLVEDGHRVRALVRAPERARGLADLGVELVPGDLADAASLDALCAGAEALFHVAGWYQVGSRTPRQGWVVNVEGTRAVLEAAERAGVPRVVYTSTLAVNSDTGGRVVDESYRFTGRHLSVYDETKARAHELTRQAAARGLPVVTVQPGVVYGPGDTSQTGRLVSDVVAGARPVVPDAGGVCWGYIDDVARGHVLALRHGRIGESYMLAGPAATLAEGLRVAARVAGTRGPRVVPRRAVAAGAAVTGAAERRLRLPLAPVAEPLRVSLASYLGSAAKAVRELGWSSRSLEEGMAPTVALLQRPAAGS